MVKATSESVNGVVRWKTLIPLIIALVMAGGGAGVYALNANKEYLHPDAVRFREIESISRDIGELKADVREVRKMLTDFIMDKK